MPGAGPPAVGSARSTDMPGRMPNPDSSRGGEWHRGSDSCPQAWRLLPSGALPDQAPYVHDQALAGIGVGLVDASYAAATRWWDVGDHLRAQAAQAGLDPDVPPIRELLLAVPYALRLEHWGTAGCDLRPQTETADFSWPPRIAPHAGRNRPHGFVRRTSRTRPIPGWSAVAKGGQRSRRRAWTITRRR